MTRSSEAETAPLLESQEAFDFGPPRPSVHLARSEERRSVVDVLGRAFHDDPVAIHLFPDAASRTMRWARFSGLAWDAMGETAHVLTTESVRGAAIWQAPGPTRLGRLRRGAIGFRFLAVAGRGFRRMIRLSDRTSAVRMSEPHYYLAALGTDPAHQGKGIGSALMQPVLDRCDREGTPAYLESSKAANVPFYQKHGFEIQEEIQIPDGPTVWAMARPPAQRSAR